MQPRGGRRLFSVVASRHLVGWTVDSKLLEIKGDCSRVFLSPRVSPGTKAVCARVKVSVKQQGGITAVFLLGGSCKLVMIETAGTQ